MLRNDGYSALLRAALEELRETFGDCRGPGGRVLLVASSASGSASVCSSTSAAALNGMLIKNPLYKVILARTVQAQHQQFQDHGLLALHLCLRLVETALEEARHGQGAFHSVVNAYHQAVDWLAEYVGLGHGSSTGAALGLPCIQARRLARPTKQRDPHQDVASNNAVSSSSSPHKDQDLQQFFPHKHSKGRHAKLTQLTKDKAAPVLLPPVTMTIRWSHLPTMMAVVRAVVGSKPVAALQAAALEKVVAAVVEAFLAALDPSPSGQLLAPRVHVVAVPGLPATASSLLSGVVLLSGACGAAARRLLPWAGGRVAVFDVPLDVQQEDLMTPAEGDWEAGAGAAQQQAGTPQQEGPVHVPGGGQATVQLQRLLELVERLAVAGASVVACQKVMHPAVVSALMARGIVPLQRLSALHVTPFCHATGALPLSSACPPSATLHACMGSVGTIQEKVYGGRVYLAAHGSPDRPPARQQGGRPAATPPTPPCTLLLGAPSQAAADELKLVVQSVLHTLTLGLQVPEVVPGGGCAEALMAAHLRSRVAASGGRQGRLQQLQKRAVEALAEGLEEAAGQLMGQLQPSRGQGGASAVELMVGGTCERAAATASVPVAQVVRYIGWDHHRRRFCPVAEAEVPLGGAGLQDARQAEAAGGAQEPRLRSAHLLDLLAPKMGAIIAAVEAAAAVLTMDGVLLSDGGGAEGGPLAGRC